MKKSRVSLLVLLFLILTSLIYFFSINSPQLTGDAVFNYPIETHYTNELIRSTWDTIFQESSADMSILINNSNNCDMRAFKSNCTEFRAFKNKNDQFFILFGESYSINDSNLSFNSLELSAFKVNITDEFISNFSQILSNESYPNFIALASVLLITHKNITPLTNPISADSEFRRAFRIIPPSLEFGQEGAESYYSFNDSVQVYRELERGSAGGVSTNRSLIVFSYEN